MPGSRAAHAAQKASAEGRAEKITELDLLARQGVVSEDEYKRQKARLLASQFLASGSTQDWTKKLVGGQLREVGESN